MYENVLTKEEIIALNGVIPLNIKMISEMGKGESDKLAQLRMLVEKNAEFMELFNQNEELKEHADEIIKKQIDQFKRIIPNAPSNVSELTELMNNELMEMEQAIIDRGNIIKTLTSLKRKLQTITDVIGNG